LPRSAFCLLCDVPSAAAGEARRWSLGVVAGVVAEVEAIPAVSPAGAGAAGASVGTTTRGEAGVRGEWAVGVAVWLARDADEGGETYASAGKGRLGVHVRT